MQITATHHPKGKTMSLEAALQEHTAVMRELLARLTAGSLTAVTMTGTEYVAKLDAEAAAAEAPATKPTTAKEAVAAAKASAAAAAEKVQESAAKVQESAAKVQESAAKVQESAAKVHAATEAAAALDYEKDVRPLLLKVSLEKGRDALIALLAKFNVTKGDQLTADQLEDVLAAANELLGG